MTKKFELEDGDATILEMCLTELIERVDGVLEGHPQPTVIARFALKVSRRKIGDIRAKLFPSTILQGKR